MQAPPSTLPQPFDLTTIPLQHDLQISTARLRLRPVHPPTDLSIVHAIRRQPSVMRYMHTGVETNPDPFACYSLTRIQLRTLPGFLSFAIDLPSSTKSETTTIGFIGCTRPTELFYLFDSAHWGKGYATEVVAAFVKVYFERFPMGVPGTREGEEDCLFAHIEEGNLGSENVARKVGFEYVRREEGESIFVIRRLGSVDGERDSDVV